MAKTRVKKLFGLLFRCHMKIRRCGMQLWSLSIIFYNIYCEIVLLKKCKTWKLYVFFFYTVTAFD